LDVVVWHVFAYCFDTEDSVGIAAIFDAPKNAVKDN
jgi:hypothetical protein